MPMMIWAAVVRPTPSLRCIHFGSINRHFNIHFLQAIEAGIQNWVDFAILLFIQFLNGGLSLYKPAPHPGLPLFGFLSPRSCLIS